MAEGQAYSHPSIDLQAWEAAAHDPAVLICDGHDIRVQVRAGQLELRDGPPRQPRTRRIPRTPRRYSRLLVLAGHGLVSVEAQRWLAWAQLPWAVLDQETGHLIASSGPQREDARLLRAQAYAAHEPSGLKVTRYLLGLKLAGQATNLREVLHAHRAAAMVDDLAASLNQAPSLDECRNFEASAAVAYWQAWTERVSIPFRKADLSCVPEHWRSFQGRTSLRWEIRRNYMATDPCNAAINYLAKVAESEAQHACHSLALSPVLGVLHTDKPNRDSFALDLIECVRPSLERIILSFMDIGLGIPSGYMDRRWLTESYEGTVFLVPPFTHRLASYAGQIGAELRPHAEYVARLLAHEASGDVKIPRARKGKATVWTTEKGKLLHAAPCLREGVSLADLLPDNVWTAVQAFIPPAPAIRKGRPRNVVADRDVCASLAAHELLQIPWGSIPGQVSASTCRARLLEWKWAQVNGQTAWEHISEAIQAAGHLSTLVS